MHASCFCRCENEEGRNLIFVYFLLTAYLLMLYVEQHRTYVKILSKKISNTPILSYTFFSVFCAAWIV